MAWSRKAARAGAAAGTAGRRTAAMGGAAGAGKQPRRRMMQKIKNLSSVFFTFFCFRLMVRNAR
jgi:hypothetical protein